MRHYNLPWFDAQEIPLQTYTEFIEASDQPLGNLQECINDTVELLELFVQLNSDTATTCEIGDTVFHISPSNDRWVGHVEYFKKYLAYLTERQTTWESWFLDPNREEKVDVDEMVDEVNKARAVFRQRARSAGYINPEHWVFTLLDENFDENVQDPYGMHFDQTGDEVMDGAMVEAQEYLSTMTPVQIFMTFWVFFGYTQQQLKQGRFIKTSKKRKFRE